MSEQTLTRKSAVTDSDFDSVLASAVEKNYTKASMHVGDEV